MTTHKKIKQSFPIHDTITGFDFKQDKPLRRGQAIRVKCLECQGNQQAEVRNCEITDCALWPYRHGRGVETGDGIQYGKGVVEMAKKL